MKPYFRFIFMTVAVAGGLFAGLPAVAAPDDDSRWREILGVSRAELPDPAPEPVRWRDDFPAALAEAKAADRPLFVTFRCLPCKQCADFDKNVLEGGPELSPLLRQFVTVRMTDAGQLDRRFFPYEGFQDLDLSWWGYFLSPNGKLYAIFGGKDHVSDATRISVAALKQTMTRVLDHHYDPRRVEWDVDGPAPDRSAAAHRPADLPAFTSFKEERPHFAKQECLHCHQVNDLLYRGMIDKGVFEKKRDLQPWPLPENVGLVVDRDDGLLVEEVEPGSAAAAAGISPGDRMAMAGGRRLFGQADFRGVLHRAPLGETSIQVAWIPGGSGAPEFGVLQLEDGWRRTVIDWRKSIYDGVIGPGPGFFPLKGPRAGKGSLSLKPFMGKQAKQRPVYAAGLRPGMEIVAVDGMSDDMDSRQFLTWFKLNHDPGDEVVMDVRDGGKMKTIRYRLPK